MRFIRVSTILLTFLLIVYVVIQGSTGWKDFCVDTSLGKMHIWSSGEGVPVLLLHGNTASGRWFTLLDVPEGYLAIAPDLPGFGSSFKSGIFDISCYSEAILQLMDALRMEKAFIFGHSLGGAVAIELVACHPDRFFALVLSNSIPFSNTRITDEYLGRALMYSKDDDLLRSALKSIAPELTDPTTLAMMFDEARKMDPHGFTENPKALTVLKQAGKLASFGKPVLYLASELDLTIPASFMRYYSTVTPRAEYHEIKGIGHSPMLEDPVEFVKVIFSFMGRIVDN